MTKHELKQIYNLNRELKMWQRELEKLRCRCLVKSPVISDMPKGGIRIDIADYASDIADYETIIKGIYTRIQLERKKIVEYIENIDDSFIRQIMFYRHVSCMTWNEVADSIGGNTENSVKKAYSRFCKSQDIL